MTLAPRPWAAELLHVWFGMLGPADWYGGGQRVDSMLERRFAREWEMLHHRPASDFFDDPRSALAAVLLFDQVPRNLFRYSARAFASDPLARAIVHGMMRRGWDRRLTLAGRQFAYMPLMHSEDIADQRLSLAMFARLPRRYGLPFARSHYRVISRFGRFPHRNEKLGRRSTPAELKAVAQGAAW